MRMIFFQYLRVGSPRSLACEAGLGGDVASGDGLGSLLASIAGAVIQGLRTRISRLGALGKLGLPLLYSQAGQESNAFCSIDRQDHTTSSGTSAP